MPSGGWEALKINAMIFNLDDKIPFVQREAHKNETIRQIIRYDSGYLKDLFLKDERVVFSEDCFAELLRLTEGHRDNWEKPNPKDCSNILSVTKSYRTPYLYDFNDEKLIKINKERLMKR